MATARLVIIGVALLLALAGCFHSPTAPTPVMILNPDLQGIH
jgi:hypothetical protein